jgi:hypothetical protein
MPWDVENVEFAAPPPPKEMIDAHGGLAENATRAWWFGEN